MNSIADDEKLFELANRVINEFGYLVVSPLYNEYKIGQIIKTLWNVKVDHPLRVIARTDRSDWLAQCQFAAAITNKEWQKGFYVERDDGPRKSTEDMLFYRVITD